MCLLHAHKKPVQVLNPFSDGRRPSRRTHVSGLCGVISAYVRCSLATLQAAHVVWDKGWMRARSWQLLYVVAKAATG